MAGRITRPLKRLAGAVEGFGRGRIPEPLAEQGPQEVAALIGQFNRMAGEIRELVANRTTLMAGISHDLRTPLTRMQLAIEMLPEGTDPTIVEGMRHDVDEMNRLIGHALEVSQNLEAGRLERVDLNPFLTQIVESFRRSSAEIRWRPRGTCVCDINASALKRIVVNLLENALRYGAGDAVEVAVDHGPEETRIHVLDSGPGIPADQREAVFRPFHRLEPSRGVDSGGSGLGLAIARQLADANGWTIRLGDRPGGGTDAYVTLPHASGGQTS
jgi:two-component system osmolarity sensor histidine kinase EnvZ